MTRQTAAERHVASSPDSTRWPPRDVELVDALMAFHHPIRRQLFELLRMEGPANVGMLARRSGIAVGSVSHHLKPLHKAGFIEPAPQLAGDSRESWWRAIERRFAWDPGDFPSGTDARHIANAAERANLAHHDRALVSWMRSRNELPEPWRNRAIMTEAYVQATPDEFTEFADRLDELMRAWVADCRAKAAADKAAGESDPFRRPVRFHARLFPSDPAGRLRSNSARDVRPDPIAPAPNDSAGE
jgi:DNA-binding transcriptional ArsR family regulator